MNINGNWMNFAYMDNPTPHGSGNAIQHLHYLPFGEDWVDQRNSSWNTPYTFSGKEKDTETGYSYFGARYYNSDLSIWLSVDPMSDKYPSMSPYNYCGNNPVMLVDPDGRDWILINGNTVLWYAGSVGDKSQLLNTYNSTSGQPGYQQAQYQNVRDKGPTPEGTYYINLKPSSERVANANPTTGDLVRSSQGGIEKIPEEYTTNDGNTWEYTAWGNKRALLQPVNVTGSSSKERDNNSYYLHDSEKCYTHGCTEVDSEFFDKLIEYQKDGNSKIDVIIDYNSNQESTKSDECN
jgi:RHS repeat-associated protein